MYTDLDALATHRTSLRLCLKASGQIVGQQLGKLPCWWACCCKDCRHKHKQHNARLVTSVPSIDDLRQPLCKTRDALTGFLQGDEGSKPSHRTSHVYIALTAMTCIRTCIVLAARARHMHAAVCPGCTKTILTWIMHYVTVEWSNHLLTSKRRRSVRRQSLAAEADTSLQLAEPPNT
jgi:hypothetical protein